MQKRIQKCAKTITKNEIALINGARAVRGKTVNNADALLLQRDESKVDAHLRTSITMVVMSAAKNTKPPKELRAMIDVRLSLAP